jgi:uncharacterized Zn finger protein (UPF0148 family)
MKDRMARCTKCDAPIAEFFSADGVAVCRVCFYAEQTAAQDARAEQALLDEWPESLRDGVRAVGALEARKTSGKAPPKPGTMLRRGVVGILVGFVLAALEIGLLGGIPKIGALFVGVAFIVAVRGYQLRHYE